MTVDGGRRGAAARPAARQAARLPVRPAEDRRRLERPRSAPDLDRGRRAQPAARRRARRDHLPRDPLAHADQARGRRRVRRVHQAHRNQALRHPASTPASSRTGRSRSSPASCPASAPRSSTASRVDPADFADVAEHVVFIQAKFHDIDENLEDQQIPWEPVLRAIKDAGYTGTSPASTRASASRGARSSRSAASTRSCARSPTAL